LVKSCLNITETFSKFKIKTKSTKEVIEFYYEWKKSRHYQIWKKNYIPDERDTPTVVVDD
jgi:hypothetical protein